eukprot:2349063-Amphidinium_carterae.1
MRWPARHPPPLSATHGTWPVRQREKGQRKTDGDRETHSPPLGERAKTGSRRHSHQSAVPASEAAVVDDAPQWYACCGEQHPWGTPGTALASERELSAATALDALNRLRASWSGKRGDTSTAATRQWGHLRVL